MLDSMAETVDRWFGKLDTLEVALQVVENRWERERARQDFQQNLQEELRNQDVRILATVQGLDLYLGMSEIRATLQGSNLDLGLPGPGGCPTKEEVLPNRPWPS